MVNYVRVQYHVSRPRSLGFFLDHHHACMDDHPYLGYTHEMTKVKIEMTKGSVYGSLYDPRTAQDMMVKADLMREIIGVKESRNLNQSELGKIIGMKSYSQIWCMAI